jgi:predicted Zn-dependent protease
MIRKPLLAAALSLVLTGAAVAQSGPAAPPLPREHAQMAEAYGGVYSGPLSAYVSQVGARVADAAGRRNCVFTVLNNDAVNAFAAPPGCYIFVTRGLLALANTEDELAAVLGHEVGHVAARHAERRQSRSTIASLGALVLGAVTKSQSLAQLAGGFAQLNILSYSREQEYEADQLGIRYLSRTGYHPEALGAILSGLQAQDQLEARTRGRQEASVPEWARTHPLTEARVARALQQARQVPPPAPPAGADPYLARIDGLLYGDDPEQGLIDGRSFAHPRLGIAFAAPAGFALTNSPRAVRIEGPSGLKGEFSAGALRGDLEEYAVGVARRVAGQTPIRLGRVERRRINGLESVLVPALAQTANGALVELTVVAYAVDRDSAYHFVTLAPRGQSAAFDPLFDSFRRLPPQEASRLRPRRIEVVTVRAGETVDTLARRMAYTDYPEERLRVLNGLGRDEPVRPGQRIKLVVYGRS